MLFPFRRRRDESAVTRVPLTDDGIYVHFRTAPEYDGKVERIGGPTGPLAVGELRELIARRDV